MAMTLMTTWLAAGLTFALLLVAWRQVAPGFFRDALLVVFGLWVAAGVCGWNELHALTRSAIIANAGLAWLAYVGWSAERHAAARVLTAIATFAAAGTLVLMDTSTTASADGIAQAARAWPAALLLGSALAAMLLGHYYLTAPWMSLTPLFWLTGATMAAAVLRGLSAVVLLDPAARNTGLGELEWWIYLALRWGAGAVGPFVLGAMVWQTVRLKATQAATGILYVVVLATLVGESAGLAFGRMAGRIL